MLVGRGGIAGGGGLVGSSGWRGSTRSVRHGLLTEIVRDSTLLMMYASSSSVMRSGM